MSAVMCYLTGSIDVSADVKPAAESDSLPAEADQLASVNGKLTGDSADITPVHTKQSESVIMHSFSASTLHSMYCDVSVLFVHLCV